MNSSKVSSWWEEYNLTCCGMIDIGLKAMATLGAWTIALDLKAERIVEESIIIIWDEWGLGVWKISYKMYMCGC